MTVFKTFFRIVNKLKPTIILYTALLIIFGAVNMKTSDNNINFVNSKPDILIINQDVNKGLTKNLIDYMKKNSNIMKVENNEEKINDALFYREVSYVIYIPKDYRKNVLLGNNPKLDIKKTDEYDAHLSEMMLKRYIKLQNIYNKEAGSEDELITLINDNINDDVNIKITSKVDTSKTYNIVYYFNFASYSILAIIIYIVCLVLCSFKEESISKRINISSINYKSHNNKILLASIVFSSIVWLLFVIIGVIVVGDIMFSLRGLISIINSFIFTFCALTLSILISSITNNKNAISGIVNVIALGSAFLCGAFVPAEYLPSSVLNFAHILPAYYYINSNDLLKNIDVINISSMHPIIINMVIIIIFSILFIILNNIVTRKKRKSN
jgi:ABC-2 type transport system permease protein